MAYLGFVDGLRAVAIISVVAFHARLPGFGGGYLGVDIFFVISGFLILRLTMRDLAKGSFSVAEFAARRMLRIVPPLAVVLIACFAGASFFPLTPPEHADLVASAQAASTFWANFHYWKAINYFNPMSDMKPLLHTWSLSVEEQFYGVVAVVALIIASVPLPRQQAVRTFFAVVVIVGLVSAILFFVDLGHSPEAKFYLTHFRAWEFALGGVAAAVAGNPSISIGRHAGAVILASAIVLAGAIYIGGDFALPAAVIATAILLTVGARTEHNTTICVLSSRAARGIGKVSYSWYLWHWPAMFLGRSLDPLGMGNATADLVGAGLSFLLAILTYIAVERPLIRLRHAPRSKRQSAFAAGAGFALVTPVLAISVALPTVNSDADRRFGANARHAHIGYKWSKRSGERIYRIGAGGAPSPVVIWGDSQARHLIPAAAAIVSDTQSGIDVWASGGCPPIIGEAQVNRISKFAERCNRFREKAQRWLDEDSNHIHTVILAARWHAHWERTGEDVIVERLSETVRDLRARGKTVVLVAPIPDLPFRTPDCIYRAEWLGDNAEEVCRVERSPQDVDREKVLSTFHALASEDPTGVLVIDALPEVCTDAFCMPVRGGKSLYADKVHLNEYGSVSLKARFMPLFRQDSDLAAAAAPH